MQKYGLVKGHSYPLSFFVIFFDYVSARITQSKWGNLIMLCSVWMNSFRYIHELHSFHVQYRPEHTSFLAILISLARNDSIRFGFIFSGKHKRRNQLLKLYASIANWSFTAFGTGACRFVIAVLWSIRLLYSGTKGHCAWRNHAFVLRGKSVWGWLSRSRSSHDKGSPFDFVT